MNRGSFSAFWVSVYVLAEVCELFVCVCVWLLGGSEHKICAIKESAV